MNKKVLIAIIVVLVLILAAGIVFVTWAGKTAEDPQSTEPQTTDIAAENAQQEQQPAVDDNPEATPAPTDAALPIEESDDFEIPTEPEDTALIPGMSDVTLPEDDDGKITYEEYHAMTGEQQAAFINSFESYDAFFEWYNAAEQEYKEAIKHSKNQDEYLRL